MSLDLITPEFVKALRSRLALSQPAFADRLGVSVQAVRHWEQGIRTPTGLYAKALRDIDRETS